MFNSDHTKPSRKRKSIEETQPSWAVDPLAETQLVRKHREPQERKRRGRRLLILVILLVAAYFFAPLRTTILFLGIDEAPEGTALGRSDTMILMTVVPLRPYVGMLSIPRDLWVPIPGVGENRINTAHFFAEGAQAGSGPAAAVETVETNFGLNISYFARIKLEGFREIVNALGGVEIQLDAPAAGLPAGRHFLDGQQALAFVRNRQNTDDFSRMANTQVMIKGILTRLLNPLTWPRLPTFFAAVFEAVDTNIPFWQWPRLGLAILRRGIDGIDNRTLEREMVTPFTTSEGASVLLPNWNVINPLLLEMFGQ